MEDKHLERSWRGGIGRDEGSECEKSEGQAEREATVTEEKSEGRIARDHSYGATFFADGGGRGFRC